jgi:hypothetical protein
MRESHGIAACLRSEDGKALNGIEGSASLKDANMQFGYQEMRNAKPLAESSKRYNEYSHRTR